MNSTPQEKLLKNTFCRHLDPNVFAIFVHRYATGFSIAIYIYSYNCKKLVFCKYYKTQQEVLDKAEEVCMMVTFGVGQ